MYPIRINLLSKEKKNSLQRIIIFQFVRTVLQGFLIIICLSGIFLLAAQSFMQSHFSAMSIGISDTSNSHAEINKKINTINQSLSQADAIQKQYKTWTDKINLVSEAIPENIRLNELTIDLNRKTVTLSGFALNRENLLELKTKLLALDCKDLCIESVPISPSQLTKKTDISFGIEAKIK